MAFAKFDQDGDGRLDIKEFKKMMHKYAHENCQKESSRTNKNA